MSELPSDPLDTVLLHNRSLRDWHRHLTTNADGEPTGHLLCPTSRYGRTADDNAWWAIAAEAVYESALGDEGEPTESLEYLMGLAVNDSVDIATLVADYWFVIPAVLHAQLGSYEDVKQLIEGGER